MRQDEELRICNGIRKVVSDGGGGGSGSGSGGR